MEADKHPFTIGLQNSEYITSHFQCSPDKIPILNIADRYSRDGPELVSVLQKKVPPILKKN
jgi:predicted protein tyrosine phosphatase